MRVGVLGTGMVGRTIAGKLAELGHEVVVGTRDPAATLARQEPDFMGNPPYAAWQGEHPAVRLAGLAEAAAHGELVVNATSGGATLEALRQAGAANLDGKVLVDVANPLDFSQGMPPSLSVANTDSLAECIQREFPAARVVKTLNTVNASLMVDPGLVGGGDHTVFVSGNDPEAKALVTGLLTEGFGWRDVVDLGDITTARGPEMLLPLWLRLMGSLGTPMVNVKVVR
jgi:predicted dinucleotide-binding enzyme